VRAFVAIGSVGGGGDHPPAHASIDDALADAVRLDVPYLAQRDELVDRFTNVYVDRLLKETNGNQTAAAKLAGLDRTYLGRLLAKIGRR
jgi:hypothetical protein